MWSDTCSEISQLGNAANNMSASMVSSTDSSTICGDHEYHEISDEENQDSPLRFDKPLSFDFGPSLLDEMDQMFRSLGTLSKSMLSRAKRDNYVKLKSPFHTISLYFLFYYYFFLSTIAIEQRKKV